MLKTLYIKNFALIDELTIEFGSGLNIITGETGGHIWRVRAHSAGEHDGVAACPLIEACSAIRRRLPKILGDGAYAKTFAQRKIAQRCLA